MRLSEQVCRHIYVCVVYIDEVNSSGVLQMIYNEGVWMEIMTYAAIYRISSASVQRHP